MKCKKVLTATMILAMLTTVLLLPVNAKTMTSEQELLSMDFEQFNENATVWELGWYNDSDNRGYSDYAAQTTITGGKMGVGGKYRTVNDITSNNGLITIQAEGDNKYLSSFVKAETNYVGFVLDTPVKEEKLVLSFDAKMPTDGTNADLRFVYEKDGTKELSQLMRWSKGYGSVWMYTESGNTKSYIFESVLGNWIHYTLTVNLVDRTYTYQASKVSDGTVLDTKTDQKLPAATAENLYGFEFYFIQGNSTDAFSIDNVELSRETESYYLDTLQDYEEYAVGAYTTGSFGVWNDFYGNFAIDEDVNQGVGAQIQINGKDNGHIVVAGDEQNKYLELYSYLSQDKTPAYLGYALNDTCQEEFVQISLDARMKAADSAGGIFQLAYTDTTTTTGEYINLFKLLPWDGVSAFGADSKTVTLASGDSLADMLEDWVTYHLQFDLKNNTYSIYLIDQASGVVLAKETDLSLPEKTYSNFRGFRVLVTDASGLEKENRKPLDVDNVAISSNQSLFTALTVGDRGTVKVNGVQAENNAMLTTGTKTLEIIPSEGYEVSLVTIGESSVPVNAAGETISVTTKGNDTVSVSFKEKEIVKATIDSIDQKEVKVQSDYSPAGSEKTYPSIFAFSKLNENYGWTIQEFGFQLYDSNGNQVDLSVEKENTTSEGYFAVRMYGDGLKSGETYYLKPYLKQARDGETDSYEDENEVSVTVK